MARRTDDRDDTRTAGCPLHCGSRNGDRTGSATADHVDSAGLPVNLDLAFSQNQRDKVYAQYLRRRKTLIRRGSRDVTRLCVCEVTDPSPDTDRSVSNR